ncbi:MAG: gliding motility-associated C-terminal domain-containing protein [Bacteroidia bacterium]|nr:gliding motility-associated C-terminal domain-containing protein [Bacteroidia bacterium]
MFRKLFFILLLTSQSILLCFSQTITNNGELIHISNGAVFHVSGSFTNGINGILENNGDLTVLGDLINNSQLNSSGIINLSGNWQNNSVFNHNNGNVFLEGTTQNIGGANPSKFYNLTLTGNGIKSLNQNVNISNSLALNDKEIDIANFNLFIENPDISAISRTTGFVSNNLQGRLIRNTNSNATYLYPLGSSINTQRYRPIEIIPANNSTNKYSAGMVNHDADIDGFNLNQTDTNLCNLNNKYYHFVNRDSGSTYARIIFYYDSLADGIYTTAANWHSTPPAKWKKTDSTSYSFNNPYSKVTINHWLFTGSNIFTLGNLLNKVELGQNITGCFGDTILLDASNQFTSYLWSNGANTQTINAISSGIYYVTVSANNCFSNDSVTIALTPLPLANAGSDVSICNGDSVQLNATGGTSYNWITTAGLNNPNISNPIANPLINTSYIVNVTNGQCSKTDTVLITVLSQPTVNAGSDTTIFEGSQYQFLPIVSNYSTAIWTPNIGLSNANILNSIATVNTTTTYILTVYDNNGCFNSDDITLITIPKPNYDIIIFNTFTPNIDNVNDTWFIENISKYPDNHLSIYNRNGHIVYEKHGYNNEWDGKYYGNDLPEATYYYVLKISGQDVFKGDVTIIR